METIYWHDYETFGADTRKDRPCQFAGVRTDLDLNIIEEPASLYCKPNDDFLPSPDACLITGITPQLAYKEGLSEAEFSSYIHTIFSVPGTCVAGYNSIRFDDEISRNLFYRNFYDPDEREWKDKVHMAPVHETDDPARAARRIMTDDGFNTGILYRGHRKPYTNKVSDEIGDSGHLERAFEI